jgi:proteasome accessory factor B
MDALERLLNLVGLLLESRRPLTFEDIRGTLAEAYGHGDVRTAKRMFERDKDILRDNGVPIETTPTDAFDVEVGYVIPKDRYYLPEISFTPQEISALYVAARSGGEDAMAERAVGKLLFEADGSVVTGASSGPLALGPEASSDRLDAVAEAVLRGRRCVSFDYRTARGDASRRRVDAHGLVWRAGNWYLVGLDRERGDVRSFRLSRFTSDVEDAGEGSEPPQDFRASEHVEAGSGGSLVSAVISFSPRVARWATAGIEGASTSEPDADGWVRASLATPDGDEAIVGWVLGFGHDARVLEPPALRDDVMRRLEALDAG